MELLDIYTDKYKYIGTASREEVHSKGLWHRVVTCQVINPKTNKAIFQRRYPRDGDKINHSNSLIDITIGGHYVAGEKIEDCVREIEEELLEKVNVGDLIPLGIRQSTAIVSETYIINEFQHLFLLPLNKEFEEYKVTGKEVACLVEIDIDEGINLLLGKVDKIKARELYLDEGVHKIIDKNISLKNLITYNLEIDRLYLRILIAAKRYISGENPELIMW